MSLFEREPERILEYSKSHQPIDENPILKPLTLKDFRILEAVSLLSGSIGVSLIVTGHSQIGILLTGATATIHGGEWAIRRFIKPQKK